MFAKRILSFLFALILAFTFTGCENKEEKKGNSVDIEYYARLGKMPECDYSLGADAQTVKDEIAKASEQEEHIVYEVVEGKNNVLINNGAFEYYYKKANESEGITYIVNRDVAYGFETGTVILEVKEALADYDFTEEELTEENGFFMFSTENGSVLKYEFKENTVMFVFQDNSLCATALYKTKVW